MIFIRSLGETRVQLVNIEKPFDGGPKLSRQDHNVIGRMTVASGVAKRQNRLPQVRYISAEPKTNLLFLD